MLSRWDVRLRVLAVLIWLVGVLLMKSIASCWMLTAIALSAVALDPGMRISKVFHQFIHVLPFVLLMLITLGLSGGIPLQRDALFFAALVSSRVVTAVVLVIAMVSGSSVEDFLRSLAVLPLPKLYLSLLLLVNRFVVLLTREFQKQRMALRSRMFVPKANPGVLKNLGYVVGGLFIRGYDRSEAVYEAMRSRCYDGVVPLDEAGRLTVSDFMKLIFSAAVLVFVFAAERRWMI